MRVTTEMRDALVAYKNKHDTTNVELSKAIGMSSQNLGRILSGQVAATSDDCGQKILRLVGMKEAVVYEQRPRHWVRIQYNGKTMTPIVEQGDILVGEKVVAADLEDGDLVVIQFKKTKDRKGVELGYFYRESSNVTIQKENGDTVACTHAKVDWMLRVILPVRSIAVGG